MDAAPQNLIDSIATALETCGETKFGAEWLTENGAPPRYVWVPITDEYRPPSIFEAPESDEGLVEETLGCFSTTFVVHCWGHDYAQAFRMRAALITALRSVVGSGNYGVGGAQWINGGPSRFGWAVLQTLTILTPILEQTTPATLGDDIADARTPTAQATTVAAIRADFDE